VEIDSNDYITCYDCDNVIISEHGCLICKEIENDGEVQEHVIWKTVHPKCPKM